MKVIILNTSEDKQAEWINALELYFNPSVRDGFQRTIAAGARFENLLLIFELQGVGGDDLCDADGQVRFFG